MEYEELRRRMRAELEPRGDVAAAWIFGSRARGTARAASDVDVAVLFSEDPPRTLDGLPFGLRDDLEDGVELPVDLVVANHAPADLVHRILRDGDLVVEHDRSRRVRFEVRRRKEYFDLLPMLRLGDLDRFVAAMRRRLESS